MERKGNWIKTYTGRRFYAQDPQAQDITLMDIAHALSNLCRFTGHGREFYSVAQHSLLVTELLEKKGCPTKILLYAILHDASEAYLNDIAKPFKDLLPQYIDMEHSVQNVIWERFGLPQPTEEEYPLVKYADNVLLINEIEQMMGKDEWDLPAVEHEFVEICSMPSYLAKHLFIKKVNRLLDMYECGK